MATSLPMGSNAAPVVYDDRTLFIQNVNPNGSEDFESAAPMRPMKDSHWV